MATFLKTKNTVGRVTAKLMSPDCDVNCNEELYECVEARGGAIVWPDDLDSPINISPQTFRETWQLDI